jgi:starvation-inducible DNA-binding protein
MKIENLNILLSSLLVIRYNIHFYHWTICGPNFMELHSLFQKQYEEILLFADKIAEHIRCENQYPPISLSEIIKYSFIKDNAMSSISKNYNWKNILNKLKEDMIILKNYISDLPDYNRAISNTLAELDDFISKQIWFLSSYKT